MGTKKGLASRIRFATSGVDAFKGKSEDKPTKQLTPASNSPKLGDVDIAEAAARIGLDWQKLAIPQRRKLRELALTMMPADTVRRLIRSAG